MFDLNAKEIKVSVVYDGVADITKFAPIAHAGDLGVEQ